MATLPATRRDPRSGRAPSDKQLAYVTTLLAERDHDLDVNTVQLIRRDSGACSLAIDTLRLLPRRPRAAVPGRPPVTEPGMYWIDRGTASQTPTVARVKRSGAGRLYAMALDVAVTVDGPRGSFEYAAGLIGRLSDVDRMTGEEAAALGREFSVCVCCGAELSDPVSVARGIGPVCAKRV